MFRLCARIEIKGDRSWSFDFANAVEITRDMEKLTTEAKITMPKKVKWDGADEIPVKRGDTVTVSLGYDGNLQTAFAGYVRDVGFKTPIVITCEDDMFKLKQMPAQKKAYRSVTLETLLKNQGINYRLNIISDQSLQQQKAENMRLLVKAVSLMPDNKKIKVEVGDADGERRTLHTYNKTESELKAWAQQEVKRLKRDGLTGSFTTFGHTLVDCLDAVGIIIDGVKMGVYQVKKNVIKYGDGGFRQEITLGLRVG